MLQKEYEPVHKPINFSLLANWALSDAVANAPSSRPPVAQMIASQCFVFFQQKFSKAHASG
jgi:hypothetical protein